MLLAGTIVVCLGGCAAIGGRDTHAALASDPEEACVAPAEAMWDTLEVVEPAPPPEITLPVGPEGYAGLADLETFLAETMRLAAVGELALAHDQLFILQDQVEAPLPPSADTAYRAHRASIGRRVTLLAGVMAEQTSFSAAPDAADSLLAVEYGSLARFSFPDSLVPAMGTTLPAITADLLKVDNPAVGRWVNYFTGRGRRHFGVWLERKAAVDSLVTAVLEAEGLPRELIYLGLIESGFSPRAVSTAGAVGHWQFMPGTARNHGLRTNWWVDERRDIEMSTRAAAKYLKGLYAQFGDWALVLAAYNTGEGRVARKIRQHGHDNFWDLRLPAQTTAHIPKFIAAARIGEDPQAYGFAEPSVIPLAYDIVPVTDATDLELIASCAGAPATTVLALNPALLRGASPPDLKNYPVRVPKGSGSTARRTLARVPASKRLTWRSHRVRAGETLGQIARDYGSSVADIAKLNKLADVQMIRPGDQLLIPMPAELAARAQKRAAEKGHYVPPSGYRRVSYKVKSGDTLGGIANTLGVSLTHLRKVNNIHRTNMIHPGQRIYAYRPAG